MRFLVDRCAGPWLADWLGNNGHDVAEAQTLGPDPGDRVLLERAEADNRVLVTMDKDFGELIYLRRVSHAGLILLTDVRVPQRIEAVRAVIEGHHQALEERAVVTVRDGGLVRHARRLVFQLAEVLVARGMPAAILERISQLGLAPG